MLAEKQRQNKRAFDFSLAFLGLALTGWLILLAWVLSSLETRSNGLFAQERVGKDGRIFKVFKIKTMVDAPIETTATRSGDPRITRLGKVFRKTKIDELPQLINVLLGDMSFVGPRPDVPGYADRLTGCDRRILELRPGITGPATLAFRNEEELLEQAEDPVKYNDEVIYPQKVWLNLEYLNNYSLSGDLCYIFKTVFG